MSSTSIWWYPLITIPPSRLLVNSTVGILGIFDPASEVGLNNYEREDYGQTLAKWGMDNGCYVVLPVLGPPTYGFGLFWTPKVTSIW